MSSSMSPFLRTLNDQSSTSQSSSPQTISTSYSFATQTSQCLNPSSQNFNKIVEMVVDISTPLWLLEAPSDEPPPISYLFYNAMMLEIRDLSRFLDGLHDRCSESTLKNSDINSFYSWFETFFGLLTSLFDAEEDLEVLHPNSSIDKQKNIALNKKRAKESCWDIIKIKSFFDKKNMEGKYNLIFSELRNEAELLSARIISYLYISLCDDDYSIDGLNLDGIEKRVHETKGKLSFEERCLIESALMKTLKASEMGKMLICAIARGFVDVRQRNGFLEEGLRGSGKSASKVSVQKQLRKFRKVHSDIVDKYSVQDLILGHIRQQL